MTNNDVSVNDPERPRLSTAAVGQQYSLIDWDYNKCILRLDVERPYVSRNSNMSLTRLPFRQLTPRVRQITARASVSQNFSNSQVPSKSSRTDQHIADKKDAQAGNAESDPTRIDRQSQEYGLSGTDDAVAQDDAVSFQHGADPEQSRRTSARNNDNDPLQVSPANPDASLAGTEYVNAVEFRPEKDPVTTKSQGKAKTRTMRDGEVDEQKRVSRAYAGADKRKNQSPQEVAKTHKTVAPGTR